jgi:hypothetical protein
MKRLWQEKRKAKGLSIHEPGPNIVMGSNAQVALEKFARYFEVECRLVPVSVESKYRLDPKKAVEMCDENTIGVYVILGSTYTGHYEPVKVRSNLQVLGERVLTTTLVRKCLISWTNMRLAQAIRSLSTLMVPRVDSSRRLRTPSLNGTSVCHVWCQSTPRATSSACPTSVSAGLSGATKHISPKTSSSSYTTSAPSSTRSHSTSHVLHTRSLRSTSTLSILVGKVTNALRLTISTTRVSSAERWRGAGTTPFCRIFTALCLVGA